MYQLTLEGQVARRGPVPMQGEDTAEVLTWDHLSGHEGFGEGIGGKSLPHSPSTYTEKAQKKDGSPIWKARATHIINIIYAAVSYAIIPYE